MVSKCCRISSIHTVQMEVRDSIYDALLASGHVNGGKRAAVASNMFPWVGPERPDCFPSLRMSLQKTVPFCNAPTKDEQNQKHLQIFSTWGFGVFLFGSHVWNSRLGAQARTQQKKAAGPPGTSSKKIQPHVSRDRVFAQKKTDLQV